MGKYQAYPEYTKITSEWLTEIPAGWSTTPLKHVANINMGQSPNSEDCNIDGIGIPFLQGNAEFGTKSPTEKQFCPVPKKVAKKGDLLFSVRAPVGALNFADKDFGIGRGLCSIRGRNSISQSFLWWVLPSYRYQFDAIATGSTFEAVSAEEVGNLLLALPTHQEQTQIANFLDHETAKIDALIEKQQQLISLLQEKRQAVISHAVTKGLNPDVPMKDSGVEWLGQVPEHWVVSRFKYCTTRVIVGIAEAATHAYDDSGTILIRSTNIKEEGITTHNLLYLKKHFAEQNASKYINSGDIVTVRTGYPGISAVVPDSMNKCHCFTNLISTPRNYFSAEFLTEYLNSDMGKAYFDLNAWGSAQKNISVPILQEFPISHPDINEQRIIADFVKHERTKFDRLLNHARKSIQLMQERRTALISAAVTGKIDVRNWQAPSQSSTTSTEEQAL
ncbi:restriction endonuclease subunit S [Plesiomonas sp. ZOR0011]|uniref:restriction endonuclease subunit S n=1 Tax=Plesiomonas sp. ZOR0011 TaxID=1339230 RepID=UPI0006457497|nr:restriction endonuclease subunit S [Plesiomonas sp. ZOR0011]